MSEVTRLYRWQDDFSAQDEISLTQARSLLSFVRAHVVNGEVDHAETVKAPDQLELVIYYNQLPSDELICRHQERYGKTCLAVALPRLREGENTIAEMYHYDRDGALIDRVRTLLDSEDLPRYEWRYDRTGALYETVEYEYDRNGDVAVVRSRAADGSIIHEDRPPLSD